MHGHFLLGHEAQVTWLHLLIYMLEKVITVAASVSPTVVSSSSVFEATSATPVSIATTSIAASVAATTVSSLFTITSIS